MASQQNITLNLQVTREAIRIRTNALNAELSKPVSQQDPAKIQKLQTEIENDKKTYAGLENELKNVTTTTSTASPSAAPNAAQPNSQEQINKQINQTDREITDLKKELNNTSPRNITKRKEIQAQIDKKEQERKKLVNDLLNVTTIPSSQATATAATSANSQNNLQAQLTEIDRQIAVLEAELVKAQKERNATKQQILNSQLGILKRQRARVLQFLKNVTTAPPTEPVRSPTTPRPPVSASATTPAANPTPNPTNSGLTGATEEVRQEATALNQRNDRLSDDWRVRLYLAPNSKYLYNDETNKLLAPLRQTRGIIFPYTPSIQVSYNAHYDPYDVVHSNYKLYAYKNSSIENIQITGEFTAQDTYEANYMLAVIHFLRSVTKMFYGKDQNPVRGTPPPICYLDGFGKYQYNKHPLLITTFTYNLPIDVDYIRATPYLTLAAGTPQIQQGTNTEGTSPREDILLLQSQPGGLPPAPKFTKIDTSEVPTYVPTKIQLSMSAIAIVSRKDVSDNFSLQKYANGSLLLGRTNKEIGAGLW